MLVDHPFQVCVAGILIWGAVIVVLFKITEWRRKRVLNKIMAIPFHDRTNPLEITEADEQKVIIGGSRRVIHIDWSTVKEVREYREGDI